MCHFSTVIFYHVDTAGAQSDLVFNFYFHIHNWMLIINVSHDHGVFCLV